MGAHGHRPPVGRVPLWALPGEIAAVDGRPPGRRTVRDWLVDAALFGIAVVIWALEWRSLATSPDPAYLAQLPGWMVTIDPWVGAGACLALWWRRRFPLPLAVAMVPALTLSGSALGAVLISIFTVAVHRGWLATALITTAQTAQAVAFALVYQPPGASVPQHVVNTFLVFVIPPAWGLVVRFRRQVLVGLRRDAERERREHGQRLAQARRTERERIAREMHDVLAHRISLLSVHAGALAYRTAQAERGVGESLSAREVTEAVGVIRDSAHQALSELGDVLAVLRTTEPGDGGAHSRDAPPPLLGDISRLAAEARAAGQRVTLTLDCGAQEPPRAQQQRTAYRVVQEGLTNARKHAPDAPVAVRVDGGPDTGLEVTVTNPVPPGPAPGIPGAGAGLAGLAERVDLDGGTLQHGALDGSFRLVARLPWRT